MASSAFTRLPDSFMFTLLGRVGVLDARMYATFFSLLEAAGIELEWISVDRERQRFSLAALQRVLAADADLDQSLFMLGRESLPAVGVSFAIYPHASDGRGVAISSQLPWDVLASDERARTFTHGLGPSFEARQVIFGRCHSLADLVETNRGKRESKDWEPPSIDEVYWLNWYGNDLVERLGRARVMSTPAHTLQALPDGSILWTTRPTPTDVESDEARIAQARARAHLVDGVSFEAELARLRDRSRRLALVEPAWDPALDAVFSRVTRVHPPEQSQLVAKLNALDIPPVTEWRPAHEVTANDDSPEATDELGMYTEQLIALVHDHVERIGEVSIDVLPELDAFLWRRNYAETAKRDLVEQDMVPALGAYVGDVLVRQLGGRWVLRQELDETAVVVGDRAWLPFARARKALATRDGALRFSTTQFVAAARA